MQDYVLLLGEPATERVIIFGAKYLIIIKVLSYSLLHTVLLGHNTTTMQ